MISYDIVVIGGGPAGITLAKRLGNKYKMAIIRPEEHSLIYCAMPYVIEDLIDEKKCFKKDELVTESGASLIRGTVTSVDFENNQVQLENDTSIAYRKLVIATGARPFIPPIEGSTLDGVMGFKTQAGLKRAVVVGAGAIGIELAQALKHKGLDVSLADMASQVLPNLVGIDFAQRIAEELNKNGIHLLLNSKVERIIGKTCANELHLDTGEVIYFGDYAPCTGNNNETVKGLVVFATGVVPELAFLPKGKLNTNRGGVLVNERMETNIPNVYAVGDCADFKGFLTGESAPGKLATNAVPMAMVLANNLLGEPSAYKGFINGAATKVYDYFVGGTGLSANAALKEGFEFVKGYSQLTTQFPIMPDKKELRVKLLAEKNSKKIIGGQVLSGEPVTTLVDLISFAIQKGATVNDLIELSYSAQPYQSFYPAGNALVMAAEDIANKL
jgi:NADPH-dependent 2,4-dienoyl-CoA reductase/sulfur reductase-like enzyme